MSQQMSKSRRILKVLFYVAVAFSFYMNFQTYDAIYSVERDLADCSNKLRVCSQTP